jgi:hypothetical protein
MAYDPSSLGVGYQPLYNTSYDQNGNPQQTLSGMMADPFSAAFGNSFNTMNNLGSTIGNAFGAVNANNAVMDQMNQNRQLQYATLGMLGNLLRSYGGITGPGSLNLHDTKSTQAAG